MLNLGLDARNGGGSWRRSHAIGPGTEIVRDQSETEDRVAVIGAAAPVHVGPRPTPIDWGARQGISPGP